MTARYERKQPPPPSLTLVFHPEQDASYVHFDVALADGSSQPAVTALPFEVSAAGAFSFVNAWWLADAALLAYWHEAEARERFLSGAGLNSIPIEGDGTQCYVATNERFTIVSFRGTQPDELMDVAADLDILPVEWDRGGVVHQGFRDALDAVWAELSDHLRRVPHDTVWFTGHSLGAALATLAADRFGHPAGVFTLGSPLVGKSDFVSGFDARHRGRSFRYTNNHDIVTRVPPPLLRFDHVRDERHIDQNGDIAALAPESVLARIEALVGRVADDVAAFKSGTLVPAVIDHTPRRYATFVWNAFVANAQATAL